MVRAVPVAERLPPQAIEVEVSVLGAMLLDKSAVASVLEILDDSCFYRESHRKIFQAIISLFERNEAADLVTVAEELQRAKKLESIGGRVYLASLLENVATTANVTYHAQIVLKKAILRRLIEVATQIVSQGYEDVEEVDELLDRAEQQIFSIQEQRLKRGFVPLERILHTTFEAIEKLHDREGGVIGVPSGFKKLDELTAGFQKGDLVIIAGRPSMGKTALALNIARNASVEHKKPVAIFSLEMAGYQLAQRMLCSEARVDAHHVRKGTLPDQDWSKLSICVGELAEAPVYIDDSPGLGVLEIRAKARRLLAEKKIEMVVIDYLQLMHGPKGAESRQQEISMISRSLKSLAKELQVPVLALSQLSRAVLTRGGDRRPQLSDLRESGALEQDADVVLFIYRGELYDRDNEDLKGKAEIIIGKQRNGPIGTVNLTFNNRYTRFDEPAFVEEQPIIGEV
ncbi:MAG: replicative DNA helicase [candidate division Zixibacteria bacterium SM23_81]|nr:MAG: replicative DNA helicase [candidate division Zixibacteria bacterium SM23_81]